MTGETREGETTREERREGRKKERTFSNVVIFLSLGAAEAVSRAEVRLFRGGARDGGGGGGRAEAGGLDVVAEEVERGRGTAELEYGSETRGVMDGMGVGLEAVEVAKKA